MCFVKNKIWIISGKYILEIYIGQVINMEKLSRNSRVSIITKILIENPNKIIGLNKFSDLLNAAKSTISEDIVIV